MTEKTAAESIEQVRRGMGHFLHSNTERIGRMFQPEEEDCPCRKKE